MDGPDASKETVTAAAFDGCTPGVYDLSLRLADGRRETVELEGQTASDERGGFRQSVRIDRGDHAFSVAVDLAQRDCGTSERSE